MTLNLKNPISEYLRKRYENNTPFGGAVLISSSQNKNDYPVPTSIRESLIRSHLISESKVNESINIQDLPKIYASNLNSLGVLLPEDFMDFQDYLDAFQYIPFAHRALSLKHALIWQKGYNLSGDDSKVKALTDRLKFNRVDRQIKGSSIFALIFGNAYYKLDNYLEGWKFKPLSPLHVGVKPEGVENKIVYVHSPTINSKELIKDEDLIHIRFNVLPTSDKFNFGQSCLKAALPTIRSILFMQEKLPYIARRRGEPLLSIQIGNDKKRISEKEFERLKEEIIKRKSGEDIFHDGSVMIQEVYQAASVGGRQTIEPILDFYLRQLVAALGVPDIALGFGGTTTMATADYQQEHLFGEVRDYQETLTEIYEKEIFPLLGISGVEMTFNPLTEEDVSKLSAKYMSEIEHGVISPDFVRTTLGYPDTAKEGTVINSNLLPFFLGQDEQPPQTQGQREPQPKPKGKGERYEIRVLND